MQQALVALQQKKSFSYRVFIFVISHFGCPPALDAQGRRPVHPSRSASHWVLFLSLKTGIVFRHLSGTR